MLITNDDQIDLERVVNDPEYRRHVILYLNAQAHPDELSLAITRGTGAHGQPGSSGKRLRFQQSANLLLRKIG